jgi:hypothetical protein
MVTHFRQGFIIRRCWWLFHSAESNLNMHRVTMYLYRITMYNSKSSILISRDWSFGLIQI